MTRKTLATMYGVGLVRTAPGTAGSFVAMLLAYLILKLPYGWTTLAYGVLAFTIIGTRSANRYMATHGTTHDPKEIVVDELVGQWLTYALFPVWMLMNAQGAVLAQMFSDSQLLLVHLVAGFALFRLFDILKPWPIRIADRKVKGGFGVMFDDLLAAIPAGMILYFVDIYFIIWRGYP